MNGKTPTSCTCSPSTTTPQRRMAAFMSTLSLVLFLACQAQQSAASGVWCPNSPKPWTYADDSDPTNCGSTERPCGPSHWSKIVPALGSKPNVCGGGAQTPINIANKDSVTVVDERVLAAPVFKVSDDGCPFWTQFADDHTFEVSFADADVAGVCSNLGLTFKGTSYTLLQLHFHSVSEHTMEGQSADAEVHMVHKDASGNLLVLGVLLKSVPKKGKVSKVNKFLDNFWHNAEMKSGLATTEDSFATSPATYAYEWAGYSEDLGASPMNPYRDFLPEKKTFYNYQGSLTTYPCTEGVTWIVYADPIYIPSDHLEKIRGTVAVYPSTIINPVTGHTNRPIQSLNGRKIYKYIDRTSASSKGKKYSTKEVGAAVGGACALLLLSVAGSLFYRYRNSNKAMDAKGKTSSTQNASSVVGQEDPEMGVSPEHLMVEVDHSDYHLNNNGTQMVALKKHRQASEVGERSEQETLADDVSSASGSGFDDEEATPTDGGNGNGRQ